MCYAYSKCYAYTKRLRIQYVWWGLCFCVCGAVQPGLEDQYRTDLVCIALDAAVALLHATVYHCTVCNGRCESLVLQLHGNLRKRLLQILEESIHIFQVFARGVVQILGISHDKEPNGLCPGIVFQIINYLCTWHEVKGRGKDSERIALGNPRTFSSVIYANDSLHLTGAKLSEFMLKTLSEKYHLDFRKLLYILIGFVAAFILSFLIICITPIKKLIPGYPTEQARREMVQNRIMLDSLKQEILQWQKQMQDIQLITSGRIPQQEKQNENPQDGK